MDDDRLISSLSFCRTALTASSFRFPYGINWSCTCKGKFAPSKKTLFISMSLFSASISLAQNASSKLCSHRCKKSVIVSPSLIFSLLNRSSDVMLACKKSHLSNIRMVSSVESRGRPWWAFFSSCKKVAATGLWLILRNRSHAKSASGSPCSSRCET